MYRAIASIHETCASVGCDFVFSRISSETREYTNPKNGDFSPHGLSNGRQHRRSHPIAALKSSTLWPVIIQLHAISHTMRTLAIPVSAKIPIAIDRTFGVSLSSLDSSVCSRTTEDAIVCVQLTNHFTTHSHSHSTKPPPPTPSR